MSLRQAAQQALEEWHTDPGSVRMASLMMALEQALAEPEQEPIGHADLGINNIYIFSESEPRVAPAGRTPLYTAPTPRKPLPAHEIVQMYDENPRSDAEMIEFARAIERAHGICK